MTPTNTDREPGLPISTNPREIYRKIKEGWFDETPFTAGPWRVVRSKSLLRPGLYIAEAAPMMTDGSTLPARPLALVLPSKSSAKTAGKVGSTDKAFQRCLANARLMASAPALYVMAQRLARINQDYGDIPNGIDSLYDMQVAVEDLLEETAPVLASIQHPP